MRIDRLTNEELARALAEYLIREEEEKNIVFELDNMQNIQKNIIIKKEEIYDKRYLNRTNEREYHKTDGVLNIPTGQIKAHRTLSAEQQTARARFLQDGTSVLEGNTPSFLGRDHSTILASIRRDVHSIVYAYDINDEIKQAAIVEAKRQGYIFHADTPLFMLQNAELIKQSAEKDINTINFVPNQAWTSELASFVCQLALKNGYILTFDSPRFLKSNIEIIKQTLRLDNNSGINIIWDDLDPEELTAIETYCY